MADASGLPTTSLPFAAFHAAIEAFYQKDLFFIGAYPKSGTTWLQVMLNVHPDILCRGEGHLLSYLAPNLGRLLRAHNQLIEQKNTAIFGAFSPYPKFQDADLQYILTSAIALLMMRSGDTQGARVIGEKTPDNVMYFPHLLALFPNAKFLHLLRDGRDCLVSLWFHNQRIDPEKLASTYRDVNHFVTTLAPAWAQWAFRGLRFAAENPGRCLTIRYEHLIARPRETVTSVLRYLGVEHERDIVDACLTEGSFVKMSGGRFPGQEDRTSFMRNGQPGDWRAHLTAEANTAFLSAAGDVITLLGYKR